MIIFWFPFACLVCIPPRDTEKTTAQILAKMTKRDARLFCKHYPARVLSWNGSFELCLWHKKSFPGETLGRTAEWYLPLLYCLSSSNKSQSLSEWVIVKPYRKITRVVNWRVLWSRNLVARECIGQVGGTRAVCAVTELQRCWNSLRHDGGVVWVECCDGWTQALQ